MEIILKNYLALAGTHAGFECGDAKYVNELIFKSFAVEVENFFKRTKYRESGRL